MGRNTDISLHVDETKPLADIVAEDNGIGFQEPPVVRARRIKELKAELLDTHFDLEDEGLVNVAEHGDRVGLFTSTQSSDASAEPSVRFMDTINRRMAATHERNVVLPHFSSPTSKILITSGSIMSSVGFYLLVVDLYDNVDHMREG